MYNNTWLQSACRVGTLLVGYQLVSVSKQHYPASWFTTWCLSEHAGQAACRLEMQTAYTAVETAAHPRRQTVAVAACYVHVCMLLTFPPLSRVACLDLTLTE